MIKKNKILLVRIFLVLTFSLSLLFSFSALVSFPTLALAKHDLPPATAAAVSQTSSGEPVVDEAYINELKKDWTFAYKKDGIYVFKKNIPKSDVVAFRGVGIIKAPLPIVLHVIRSVDKAVDWTPNLTAKKMAKDISLFEGVTWNHNHVPWPGTDRETLMHSKLIDDQKNNYLDIYSYSVDHPDYLPRKDLVRAIVHECHFIMKPVQGKYTFADLSAHVDPKGWLPTWFINMVQSKWPHTFLKSLEKYSIKEGHRPEPEFVRMVEEYEKRQKK